MKKCFINTFLIVLCFATSSCQQSNYEKAVIPKHDSIVSDIPSKYSSPRMENYFRRMEGQLGIKRLDTGTNGIEIRIWGDDNPSALKSTDRLIILRCNEEKSEGEIYRINYGITYQDSQFVHFNKNNLGIPKSGWNKFMRHLFDLQIHTLPDYSMVQGYKADVDTDEAGYTFEVAEDKRYKIYGYPNPEGRKKKFVQAKGVAEIIGFIKNEFKIN